MLPFVEIYILSIPALPRSQHHDGQRDRSRHLCSLPTTPNPKAIDWSFLRKGSANVLHFRRPPMATTGNVRATILQFSTDDDDGGRLSRQLSLLPSTQNQKSPAFLTSAAANDEAKLFINVCRDDPSTFFSFHPSRQNLRIRKGAKARV